MRIFFALASLAMMAACGPNFAALSSVTADVDNSYGPNLLIVRAKADPAVKLSANWANAVILQAPSKLEPAYPMASNPDAKSGDQIEVLNAESVVFLHVPDPNTGERVMVESKATGVVVYAPGAPVSADVTVTGEIDGEVHAVTVHVTAVN